MLYDRHCEGSFCRLVGLSSSKVCNADSASSDGNTRPPNPLSRQSSNLIGNNPSVQHTVHNGHPDNSIHLANLRWIVFFLERWQNYSATYTRVIYSATYTRVIYSATYTRVIYSATYTRVIYPATYTRVIYPATYTRVIYSATYTRVIYSAYTHYVYSNVKVTIRILVKQGKF